MSFCVIQKRRIILKKIKEIIIKNKKITVCAAAIICVLIVAGIGLLFVNRTADRKRSQNLLADSKKEIENLKKEISALDRDTFITIDNKVVVGFVEIEGLDMNYPVINAFNDKTYNYSLCRTGNKMPWDIEGMTIYGIDSFTKSFDDLQDGATLVFEDLAGEKYEYQYNKNYAEKKNKNNVKNYNDYGIKICNVEKDGKEKKYYWFVQK